jgi:hypothetical protein
MHKSFRPLLLSLLCALVCVNAAPQSQAAPLLQSTNSFQSPTTIEVQINQRNFSLIFRTKRSVEVRIIFNR